MEQAQELRTTCNSHHKSSPATRHGGAWGERRYSSYSSTSALDGGEWSASCPGRAFTPGERIPGTHCTGGIKFQLAFRPVKRTNAHVGLKITFLQDARETRYGRRRSAMSHEDFVCIPAVQRSKPRQWPCHGSGR
jgi:hypothetical protein